MINNLGTGTKQSDLQDLPGSGGQIVHYNIWRDWLCI